jgi:hypothetical protein
MRRYETANLGNIKIFSGLCFSMIRHETLAERNHNPEVAGSNPAPATNNFIARNPLDPLARGRPHSGADGRAGGRPFHCATKSESIGT